MDAVERHAALVYPGEVYSLPRDAQPPIVELHSIDDVPFLSLTLWGEGWSSDRLRPLAAELAQELSEVEDASRAQLVGGQPRIVQVQPDPDRMAAAGVSWTQLTRALEASSVQHPAGSAVRDNREVRIEVCASVTGIPSGAQCGDFQDDFVGFFISIGDSQSTNLTSCAARPIAEACRTPATVFIEEPKDQVNAVFDTLANENPDAVLRVEMYVDDELVDSSSGKRNVIVRHEF